MAKGQKQRKPKTSNGSAVGCKKFTPRLSEIQKVLLGHGMVHKQAKKK